MNERIRLLAEQACFDEIGKDYSLYFNLTKDKVEKFAELIVKECANIANAGIDLTESHLIGDDILKHFGVEL